MTAEQGSQPLKEVTMRRFDIVSYEHEAGHDLEYCDDGEYVAFAEVADINLRPIEHAPRDGTRVLLWDGFDFTFASWVRLPISGAQWYGDEGEEIKPTHFASLVPPRE